MLTKLNRTIIALNGIYEDILKLMQGISSNDIDRISTHTVIYNLFLLENGKFLLDNFIFLLEDKIHLDCHPDYVEKIISRIKKYKVRTKVDFQVTNLKCYSDVQNTYLTETERFTDSRNEIMCSRIYSISDFQDCKPEIDYHRFRVQNNIPEGSYDLKPEESFPIYFRMHEINAISLKKGCYIGQEPTNRLSRTAVIRKKLTPFFEKNFEISSEVQDSIISQDGSNIGKLCSLYNNEFGFALWDAKE